MVIFLTPLTSNLERIRFSLTTFPLLTKGSLGHAFTANICTENISQISYWPAPLLQVSNLNVLIFVHLRYLLKSVPPQPNSLLEIFPNLKELAPLRRFDQKKTMQPINKRHNSCFITR